MLNTAHRFAYPFLPAISRGLGITLEQGGLLMSARAVAGLATPLVVATVGRGRATPPHAGAWAWPSSCSGRR